MARPYRDVVCSHRPAQFMQYVLATLLDCHVGDGRPYPGDGLRLKTKEPDLLQKGFTQLQGWRIVQDF